MSRSSFSSQWHSLNEGAMWRTRTGSAQFNGPSKAEAVLLLGWTFPIGGQKMFTWKEEGWRHSVMNVGGVWSCSLAGGTLLGAAGLGCEQTVMQKLPTERLISGATWFSHCQRSKYHHSLMNFCSQSLQLGGAFDPNSWTQREAHRIPLSLATL